MQPITTLQEAYRIASRSNEDVIADTHAEICLKRVLDRMNNEADTLLLLEAKFVVPKEVLGRIAQLCNRHVIPTYNGPLIEHSFELTHGDAKVTLVANTPKN